MFRTTPPLPDVPAAGQQTPQPRIDVSRQRLLAGIVGAASIPFGVMALLQVWAQVQPLVPIPALWCVVLAVAGWAWDRDLDQLVANQDETDGTRLP